MGRADQAIHSYIQRIGPLQIVRRNPGSHPTVERTGYGSRPIVLAQSSDARLDLLPWKQRTIHGQPHSHCLSWNPPFVSPCNSYLSTERRCALSIASCKSVYHAGSLIQHSGIMLPTLRGYVVDLDSFRQMVAKNPRGFSTVTGSA